MPTFSLGSIEVGSQLYLTAAPGIEVGTRLSGGHFRNTVEQGVVTDHSSILEIAWELVRVREFPSRPCRFDALFLWPDEVRARGWHYRQGIFDSETSSQRGLYQVEVERICRIWAADMSFVASGQKQARPITRARILLLADAGQKNQAIADLLAVSPPTVSQMSLQVLAWADQRNRQGRTVNWTFAATEARIKMKRHYKNINELN